VRFGLETRHWRLLFWWLAVLSVVVQLKYHYSTAATVDLEWMFRPLSLLLEWFTGHEFYRDSNGEWVSEGADVRLAKACAGINFMLMSFMTYTWLFRPRRYLETESLAWVAGQPLLLSTAFVASWATCLLANSLRIIVAMTVNSHAWELELIGIDLTELHSLIGMVIYVPLLSLQMMLGNRSNTRDAFAAPVLLYLLLMVVVPLLTGNALEHPGLFIKHLLNMSLMIVVMCSIYLHGRHLKPLRVQSDARQQALPDRPGSGSAGNPH